MKKESNKKSLSLSKVYQLLEPAPVVMVTTARNGKPNIMTMSWYMMVDFVPPIVACVMGEQGYSFTTLKKTKQCVINIPTVDLAPTVVEIGKCTGVKVDKFKKFHLTQEKASQVNVPMIAECYANLECKVIDMKMAKKYNIFILQVLKAWITPSKKRMQTIHHCGNGLFVVDGKTIKLPFKSI